MRREDLAALFRRTSDIVDEFSEGRRRQAAQDAAELRILARAAAEVVVVGEDDPAKRLRSREIALRSLVAELATSALMSEFTVIRLLNEAVDLCDRFDAGVEALAAGQISRRHLSVILDAGRLIIDDHDRAEYLSQALDRARRMTHGRLAPVVRALAERYLPRSLDERHAGAAETRGVTVVDLNDGMAELVLRVSAVLAHGIDDRLTAQARAVLAARDDETDNQMAEVCGTGAGSTLPAVTDRRGLEQVRADIATDLLLTATPAECVAGEGADAIHATVQISVPVLTMVGSSEEPCLLAGYGPIDTDTARALAGGATGWERVMTSPVTGAVLAGDRYRPSNEMKRFLRTRDEHCRFPGCRRAMWRCDVDHTVDAAFGGATCRCNFAHLCRRHHVMKHHSAWTVRQEPGGVLIWTSPSGHDHTDRPESTVRFVLDPKVLSRRRTLRELRREADQDPPPSPPTPPPTLADSVPLLDQSDPSDPSDPCDRSAELDADLPSEDAAPF